MSGVLDTASYLNSDVALYPLWIADTTSTTSPGPLGPWSQWAFWQQQQNKNLVGIGDVDIDVFNGGMSALTSQFVIGQSQDIIPPTINDFDVVPRSTTTGNTFTISYNVSDTGGSHLKQVELWRAPDVGGSPGTWGEVGTPTDVSGYGNGPAQGTFSDGSLLSAGGYWYGIHVIDGNNNYCDDRTASYWNATEATNRIGPISVRLTAPSPIISLSGDLGFGAADVGSELDNFLTIHNSGTGTLHVTNVICPAGFTGLWSGSIAAGSSSDVLIAFQPTLPASYRGAIVVNSDAGSGANTIAVSGNGTSTDPHNPNIAIGVKMQPGNAVVMTWPTNAVGFQLESTTNLGPSPIWTPVGTAATIVNGQNVLTNPLTVPGTFFRLHQ